MNGGWFPIVPQATRSFTFPQSFSSLFFGASVCKVCRNAGVCGGAPRDPHSCCKSATFDNCVCSGVAAGACTDGVDGQMGLATCLRSQV